MISIDANFLLYAFSSRAPEHSESLAFLHSLAARDDVALSEFVLTEFYLHLRNPAVLERPLSASAAADVVRSFRCHPIWQIVGFPPTSRALHDELWSRAADSGFARRRIYAVRTALALQAFGVRDFATATVHDFSGLGFRRVWNPLLPP